MIRVSHNTKIYYGLTALIPAAVLLLCFWEKEITPFGDNCLLAMDAWGQYFPMLKEMKRALFSGNMAWSFDGGLGFNLWAQSAYYTNSFSWLFLFMLPDAWMITGLHVLIVIRFLLCAVTFAYWLEWHYKKRTWEGIVFAAAYALSSYTMAFLNQFMWLDVVVLFPLVMVSLERLFHKEKPGMYTALLALTIWTNFYIGYMVCLFCVIYFCVLLLEQRMRIRERLKKTWLFFRYSLFGGGICAVSLIPMAHALSYTHTSGAGCTNPWEWYHSLLEILKKFLPFGEISLAFEFPNVYCGIVCLVFFFAAFFLKSVGFRRKILTACTCLILLISMDLNVLDYIWHGFHYPNQLPGRWSFMFIFVVLTFALPAFCALTDLCKKFARQYAADEKRVGVFFNCIPVFLAALTICEVGANAVHTVTKQTWTTSASNFIRYDEDMERILAKYRCDNPEQTGFYRMERAVPYNLNSGQLYGYQGITYYSSTLKKAAYDFFDRLGQDAYADLIVKYYSSPVTNALFGVRYILCMEEGLPSDENLVVVERQGKITVMENQSCLPLAFMADLGIETFDVTLYNELALPREILYALCGRQAGISEAVEQLRQSPLVIESFQNTKISGTVTCEKDGILFTSIPQDKGWSVYVDGKKTETKTLLGYLLGVELKQGEHRLEFRYHVYGIGAGLLVSVLSLGLFSVSLYCAIRKRFI